MLDRWIIRITFLLPVLLAIGFWIAGYSGGMSVRCTFMKRTFAVGTVQGGVGVAYATLDMPSGFGSVFDRSATRDSWHLNGPLGFSFDRGRITVVGCPFWLVTLFLAGIGWFAWRKTGRRKTAAAFPVQPLEQPPPLSA